ncbi:MAG: hotdog fold thioesterase [Cryomorphaceae bacterium]
MAEKSNLSAWDIVEKMMKEDAFSKWLGIKQMVIEPGYAKLKLTVRPEMVNGFGIAHGGICYSLADSALAFASNGRGFVAVTSTTTISHFTAVQEEDVLVAETKELFLGEKSAHYQVAIRNQDDELVASFSGSVYRTAKVWEK